MRRGPRPCTATAPRRAGGCRWRRGWRPRSAGGADELDGVVGGCRGTLGLCQQVDLGDAQAVRAALPRRDDVRQVARSCGSVVDELGDAVTALGDEDESTSTRRRARSRRRSAAARQERDGAMTRCTIGLRMNASSQARKNIRMRSPKSKKIAVRPSRSRRSPSAVGPGSAGSRTVAPDAGQEHRRDRRVGSSPGVRARLRRVGQRRPIRSRTSAIVASAIGREALGARPRGSRRSGPGWPSARRTAPRAGA